MISVFETTTRLPLYTAAQVKWLERQYAVLHASESQSKKSPTYFLMEKAGAALWKIYLQQFSHCNRILIVVGNGNNGGDGYELAWQMLKKKSIDVTVAFVSEHQDTEQWISQSHSDAGIALQKLLKNRIQLKPFEVSDLKDKDLIVDGLLGTGIKAPPRPLFVEVIDAINQSEIAVMSIDIPSGLDGDSGSVIGSAIRAVSTVSFVGVKKGTVTGQALDYCGKLYFDDLGVQLETSEIDPEIISALPQLLPLQDMKPVRKIVQRPKNSHKGTFGAVVIVAGNQNMGGAGLLCTEAALRTGAGKVFLLTHKSHISSALSRLPEVMVVGVTDKDSNVLLKYLKMARTVVVGPGLGQDDWAKFLMQETLQFVNQKQIPCVVDADGLRVAHDLNLDLRNCIITPHPGEAAHLLEIDSHQIQGRRYQMATILQQKIADHVLLKGAGSLCVCKDFSNDMPVVVCPHGNPGMATAGMGDVLSGMIAALCSQGLSLSEALVAGTLLHSSVADAATKSGTVGLIASDLFAFIRVVMNQQIELNISS